MMVPDSRPGIFAIRQCTVCRSEASLRTRHCPKKNADPNRDECSSKACMSFCSTALLPAAAKLNPASGSTILLGIFVTENPELGYFYSATSLPSQANRAHRGHDSDHHRAGVRPGDPLLPDLGRTLQTGVTEIRTGVFVFFDFGDNRPKHACATSAPGQWPRIPAGWCCLAVPVPAMVDGARHRRLPLAGGSVLFDGRQAGLKAPFAFESVPSRAHQFFEDRYTGEHCEAGHEQHLANA